MPRGRLIGLLLAAAVAVFPAAFLHAAVTPGDAPPQDTPTIESLTGQLLVAAPDMPDPRFQHTVVLIVRHDRNGAFGIVLNRPVDKRPIQDILAALGEPDAGAEGNVQLFAGGPVQPEIGFVVHSAEYRRRETLTINDHLALTSSPEILEDIGHHRGPAKALIAFGYAGWGPGQLDDEIALRSWFTAPADPDLVFDEARDQLWGAAMARRTINL